MRIFSLVAAAAVMVTSVAANALTPLQLETSVWNAFKNKQAVAFQGMFAPNYVGLYDDGPASIAKEMSSLKAARLSSVNISNFSSRMIDNGEDMLTTYAVDVKGSEGKADISGRYWAASVWHHSGNKWLTVYHCEIKAK
ncbi:MAG TPA: nuclear transport factor 2 family protein [Sphingomicrobium sp.]|nr:nuclear transport factor 2 family protein [Sphingomicrobium sp.]